MAKRYPDRLAAACPPGWCKRAERLAREADMALPEWIRAQIRKAFEADRKRWGRE